MKNWFKHPIEGNIIQRLFHRFLNWRVDRLFSCPICKKDGARKTLWRIPAYASKSRESKENYHYHCFHCHHNFTTKEAMNIEG